jgi:tungstate transport system ATP-binding protein
MTGEDVLIRLWAAGVRFGDVTALRKIDFCLQRGERVALVGANGSGKTSLLRLLHGQLHCHAGARQVTQLDAAGAEPAQAMVFQRPFLLRLSVQNNLRIALWLRGVPRAEHAARIADALQRVGLSDQRLRPARVLSGGQQQRLALARAWMQRPEILFLDEPTASLDPGAKREVEALIEEFADEGMTVVMSTHNLGQARRLARRVVYLDAGHIVADLPCEHFFTGPLPEAAAQFLRGEVPWPALPAGTP